MDQSDRWRPSFGDLMGIAGFAMAVVVYLAQPNWEIGGFFALLAIALIIFAALRHASRPMWRLLVATIVVAGFVAFIWRPIWNSFHKDYPRVAFNWPITLNSPATPVATPSEPPDMPPLNLPGPPLSKWGKVVYLCPLPTVVDPRDPESIKAEIRRNAEIAGNATGLSIVLSDIPYGFRLDVTSNGIEGDLRLQGVQRFTVQLERASNGIFVTIVMENVSVLAIFGLVPVERGSDIEKSFRTIAEGITATAEGKCRLL